MHELIVNTASFAGPSRPAWAALPSTCQCGNPAISHVEAIISRAVISADSIIDGVIGAISNAFIDEAVSEVSGGAVSDAFIGKAVFGEPPINNGASIGAAAISEDSISGADSKAVFSEAAISRAIGRTIVFGRAITSGVAIRRAAISRASVAINRAATSRAGEAIAAISGLDGS